MAKKEYLKAVKLIHSHTEAEVPEDVIEVMIETFVQFFQDDERFDKERFVAACRR